MLYLSSQNNSPRDTQEWWRTWDPVGKYLASQTIVVTAPFKEVQYFRILLLVSTSVTFLLNLQQLRYFIVGSCVLQSLCFDFYTEPFRGAVTTWLLLVFMFTLITFLLRLTDLFNEFRYFMAAFVSLPTSMTSIFYFNFF